MLIFFKNIYFINNNFFNKNPSYRMYLTPNSPGVTIVEMIKLKKIYKHIYYYIVYLLIKFYSYVITKIENNLKLIDTMLNRSIKYQEVINFKKVMNRYNLFKYLLRYDLTKKTGLYLILPAHMTKNYLINNNVYKGKITFFNYAFKKYNLILFKNNPEKQKKWLKHKTKSLKKHNYSNFKNPTKNLNLMTYNAFQIIFLNKISFFFKILIQIEFFKIAVVQRFFKKIYNFFKYLRIVFKFWKKFWLKKWKKINNRKKKKSIVFLKKINKYSHKI